MSIDPREVVGWFDRVRRDLPWRRPEVSAWQILVSEFMLQQTPVARVEPIWRDWIARWPTPSATAAAGAADVLRAWGKLGYPRRAKRLHECATVIAAEHGDVVPEDVEVLLTLPGVGSYTARAIACFAYQQPVPVVDTNVRRVVARAVHGLADAGNPSAKRDEADVAALLPDDDTAPRFSAGLMELGALVCTARNPKCGVCPLSHCAWRTAGFPPSTAPVKKVQKYAGTDRQVRGRLMDVLRASDAPVTRAQLDVAWLTDTAQRDRALDSLLVDGLVEQTEDGRFALAGEGANAGAGAPSRGARGRMQPLRSRADNSEGANAGAGAPSRGARGRMQPLRSRADNSEGADAGAGAPSRGARGRMQPLRSRADNSEG